MSVEVLDDVLARARKVEAEALAALRSAGTTAELEQMRVRYTGKKSELSQVMQSMGRLAPDDKKTLGAEVNRIKLHLESELEVRLGELQAVEMRLRFETQRLDVTLPGTDYRTGYKHPLLQSVREILNILGQMGFAVYEGTEVEYDLYNFELLNIPKNHPSRDLQDTFYVSEAIVLRTQTSPAQLRIMQSQKPPLRVAVPGWCYRNEAEDATHGDRFFQIEGLAVDTDITLADLKGTLTEVAQRFFGSDRQVRFRPHYFPFTEPSAEYDIQCVVCRGAGCRSCGNEGWLELGGSGMVHPSVLTNAGYDPEEVSGFAFGIGIDRYTMMKFGVTDLRLFREDDLRFLRQFN